MDGLPIPTNPGKGPGGAGAQSPKAGSGGGAAGASGPSSAAGKPPSGTGANSADAANSANPQRFQSLKSAMAEGQGGAGKAGGGKAGEAPDKAATGKGMDFDVDEQRQMFIKMLTAQLKNQSPTDPMKSKEMTGQLAQFSGVEQQMQTNELLKQLVQDRPGSQRMDAVSLVGRQVWYGQDQVRLQESGEAQRFRARLDHSAEVTARIKDDQGNVVRSLDLGTVDAGTREFGWDGRTGDGQPAAAGRYRIEVRTEGQGEAEGRSLTTQVPATVNEVRFGQKGVELGVGGDRFIAFDQVASVARDSGGASAGDNRGPVGQPGRAASGQSVTAPDASLNQAKRS
jgi:flagellar basal-body rod modification protein FlgD